MNRFPPFATTEDELVSRLQTADGFFEPTFEACTARELRRYSYHLGTAARVCGHRHMEIDSSEATDFCKTFRTHTGDFPSPIHAMPAELLIEVFSHLPIRSLKRAERVCKRFRKIITTPENVDTFLTTRQHTARARLHTQVVRFTLRGFVNQKDGDFLDALSRFINRGGLITDAGRHRYMAAAMVDLFMLNLTHVPLHVNRPTSQRQLAYSMNNLLHCLIQVHVTKHMPPTPGLSCVICQRLNIDSFMQHTYTEDLEPYGFTKDRIENWYKRLWNPTIPCNDYWADGVTSAGVPLLDTVTAVNEPPEHLITHLMWHEATPGSVIQWSRSTLPVRRGLCSMTQLAAILDVPSLPEKTNLLSIPGLPNVPSSNAAVPAYFFAYIVKSMWASGLVEMVLSGDLPMDKFVKTAILEELDIY